MKKISLLLFLMLLLLVVLCFTACDEIAELSSFYLDDNEHLIAVYNDGSEIDMGLFRSELIASIKDISVDSNGFYVINGIKTNISTKVAKSYSIDDNAHLIVTYKDNTTADLGPIGDSLVNGIETITVSENGYYIINGIVTDIIATSVYDVYFDTKCSIIVNTQRIKDGYLITRPNIQRMGYTLSGWYCNDEEWRFNSDVVKNNMTLTAKWEANNYTVQFDNSKGDNPTDLQVTYGESFTLPSLDDVPGYTFAGWYYVYQKIDDSRLWYLDGDVTLTAKWEAKKYNVTLNAKGGIVSQTTVEVTYGENYILPVPTNSYGTFVGWLYNNNAITDTNGNSLSVWNLTNDITAIVDWTIKIYNANDLSLLGTYLNGEFILMNNIDMTGVLWMPVGSNSNPFVGKIDGQGYSISNLSIDTQNYTNVTSFGLLGYICDAQIRNIIIDNFTFTSQNIEKTYQVGSVAGSVSSSGSEIGDNIFENITTSGTFNITKQSSTYTIYAGGLLGKGNSAIVNNCANSISISNSTYAGGMVGFVSMIINATDSCNHADISSSAYAGGLVGYSTYYVGATRCFNDGDITSVRAAGGIGGSVGSYVSCICCYNLGDIESTTENTFLDAGGLIGCCYEIVETTPTIEIQNSYNKGNITAPFAGGLCGPTSLVKITNTYNSGNVNGDTYAGGIFALASESQVKQCLGSGSIIGSNVKSTIGASLVKTSVVDCYYTYSSTSGFSKIDGTYTTNKYGSTLYVEDMFWKEYNESAETGYWIFVNNEYPTLFFQQ